MEDVKVALPASDLQLIIDALTEKMDSYSRTAGFLADEDLNLENVLLEETNSAEEANKAATTYRRIID